MKLILIDSTLLDVDVLTSSVASSNKYVLFNSFTDTYASLINSIKDAMNEVESIDSVCVLNHGSHAALHLILHLEQDQEKWFDFWSELVSLYHIQNIDLLGCNLYSDESWRAIMDQMETELSVNVRSSSNRTGNNVDEDWIMESDGIDVRPIYFNDTINTYVHSLSTGLATFQNVSARINLNVDYKLVLSISQASTVSPIIYNHTTTNSVVNNSIRGNIVVQVSGSLFVNELTNNPSSIFEVQNTMVNENSIVHMICSNIENSDTTYNTTISVHPYKIENNFFRFFFRFHIGNLNRNDQTTFTIQFLVLN